MRLKLRIRYDAHASLHFRWYGVVLGVPKRRAALDRKRQMGQGRAVTAERHWRDS